MGSEPSPAEESSLLCRSPRPSRRVARPLWRGRVAKSGHSTITWLGLLLAVLILLPEPSGAESAPVPDGYHQSCSSDKDCSGRQYCRKTGREDEGQCVCMLAWGTVGPPDCKRMTVVSYYVAFMYMSVVVFSLLMLSLHIYSLVHDLTEVFSAKGSKLQRLLSRKMFFFIASICMHVSRITGELVQTAYAFGYLSIQKYSFSPWAVSSVLESVWAISVTWWVLLVAIIWIDTAVSAGLYTPTYWCGRYTLYVLSFFTVVNMVCLMTAAAYQYFWVAGAYSFFVSCVTTYAFKQGLSAILRKRMTTCNVVTSVLLFQAYSLTDHSSAAQESKHTTSGGGKDPRSATHSPTAPPSPKANGQQQHKQKQQQQEQPQQQHQLMMDSLDIEQISRRGMFHQTMNRRESSVHPTEVDLSAASGADSAATHQQPRRPSDRMSVSPLNPLYQDVETALSSGGPSRSPRSAGASGAGGAATAATVSALIVPQHNNADAAQFAAAAAMTAHRKRQRADQVLREVVTLAVNIMTAFMFGTIMMLIFAGTYTSNSLIVICICSTVFQVAILCYTIANMWALFHISKPLRQLFLSWLGIEHSRDQALIRARRRRGV